MIKDSIEAFFFRKRWIKNNKHNNTVPLSVFPMHQVKVGKGTYGGINPIIFNRNNKLIIGSYCSIGPNVTFVVAGEHNLTTISTFPFKSKIINGELEGLSKGNIIVDDDVWIGNGATILSGVHIGQGAVVAAGAVVNNDIPPYAIVGGVPAKVFKYRFSQCIIDYMLSLDYGSLNEELIKRHERELYNIVDNDLESVKMRYEWFPKKYN